MGTLVVDVEVTIDYYISEISRVEIKNSISEGNPEIIMTNRAFKKDEFQVIWSRKLYRMKRYIDAKVYNDTS